jgi:hypothetical protein
LSTSARGTPVCLWIASTSSLRFKGAPSGAVGALTDDLVCRDRRIIGLFVSQHNCRLVEFHEGAMR